MSPTIAALGAIFAVLVAPERPARAEPAPPAAAALPTPSGDRTQAARRWYGWQTLVADGASFGVAVAGLRSVGGHPTLGVSLASVGGAGYLFGAPAIHWAHRRPGAAGLSLSLRVGLPLVTTGLLSGGSAGRCVARGEPEHESFCHRMDQAIVVAAVLSALVASGLDAALWGFAPAVEEPRRAFGLSPAVSWDGRRGALAGLGGAF
jgi:hypothetical protein